jgi:hypothetical protein
LIKKAGQFWSLKFSSTPSSAIRGKKWREICKLITKIQQKVQDLPRNFEDSNGENWSTPWAQLSPKPDVANLYCKEKSRIKVQGISRSFSQQMAQHAKKLFSTFQSGIQKETSSWPSLHFGQFWSLINFLFVH